MSLSGLQQLNQLISELEIVVGNRKSSEVQTLPAEQTQEKTELKTQKAERVEKTEKVAKKAPEPRTKEVAEVPAVLDINSLDLRVGIIRSVVRHETAEKLYCEEIDVGEDEPRPIASGLVPFYSLADMQDRRVIVVANLLPRKLVGFKSNGMVLCASRIGSDGVEVVEFVDPPASAAAGERIIGLGLTSLPLAPKQCDKKKAFEILAAHLVVDAEGIACWNGIRLVAQSSGEHCSAPTLRDCHIH